MSAALTKLWARSPPKSPPNRNKAAQWRGKIFPKEEIPSLLKPVKNEPGLSWLAVSAELMEVRSHLNDHLTLTNIYIFQLRDKVWAIATAGSRAFSLPPLLPFPVGFRSLGRASESPLEENSSRLLPIQCLEPAGAGVCPQRRCHKSSEGLLTSLLPRWIFNKHTLSCWSSPRIFTFVHLLFAFCRLYYPKRQVLSWEKRSTNDYFFFTVHSVRSLSLSFPLSLLPRI